MEKKNKKPETNPPPTIEEFENPLINVMFKKSPTLKQLKDIKINLFTYQWY